MESAPLIKAHDHAKAASIATHTSDTTVAVNEHTRAAGEFANAARNTSSVEALRTLKLLEQHHRRLSELLQIPSKPPTSQNSENDSQGSEKDEMAAAPATPPAKTDGTGTSNEKNAQPLPTLPKQSRYPQRDLGASIASNLASARGIRSKYRSQPLSPSISNTEAPGNMETASRRSGPRSKMQTMLDNSDRPSSVLSPERATRQDSMSGKDQINKSATATDDGFSRFYSAFGSIINRISAPLAFAGLPLINEEQPETPAPATTPTPESPVHKRTKVRLSPSVTAEPDLRKIYSRAALRAVSRDGPSSSSYANDSFYVVPPSGHTASYASILTFADKEKRRLEARAHQLEHGDPEADDDFVDARESQVVALQQKAAGGGSSSSKSRADRADRDRELANVVEELYLENKSLKDMLDKVSKRLHAFESMSQNSGMRLAESMRLMRPGSPLASPGGGKSLLSSPSTAGAGTGVGVGMGVSDEVLARRNRELEEQILVQAKQLEEMERQYNKARANLVRYREKWDQLKAGAKARRAGGSGSGGVQGTGSEIGTDGGLGSPSLG
ncbi:hypothetical protein F5Y04DRAFT_259192 [Hypomontagnella monticulosa]|nr:hypothetical protein F5Y04DRAFT_259192 [Hypomontagnella monticulosa]